MDSNLFGTHEIGRWYGLTPVLWTAMRVFGKKPPITHARLFTRLHRIGGYVFLVYFATVS